MLLETSEGTYVFVDAVPGETFVWRKERVAVDPLIGAPFGSRFEVRKGKLERAAADNHNRVAKGDQGTTRAGTKRDNRSFADDNTAQRVDAESIKRLRSEGASGESIIETLIEGSGTWDKKTEFSKEKWLRRKEKKYLPWLRVLKPTSATIAAAHFARKGGTRVRMRPDSVARIVASADARDGSNILALDATGGVVIGALLERVRPTGRVFLPSQQQHCEEILRRFDFDQKTRDLVARVEKCDQLPAMHGLVLVSQRFDPTSLLASLLPLLQPSSPFVVFSETMQPLVDAYQSIQTTQSGVNLRISETWLREFQVLENRTHPAMTMSAAGGFLLSGIKTSSPLPRSDEQ